MQLTKINGKYELLLPEHRAEREQWSMEHGGWEVERIEAMLDYTKPSDVVFDIGTEEGDISALIAKESNCNMVLVEPNDRVWSCIKAIWEANKLKDPIDFYPGFFSMENNNVMAGEVWADIGTDNLIPDHGFKQLYEDYPDVPQITMDKYVNLMGIIPTVITMDVEGAEFDVVRGAKQTLRKYRPTIFMSVHPEFLHDNYLFKEGEKAHVVHMLRFIDELGYKHSCIEYDYHELHMRFDPK